MKKVRYSASLMVKISSMQRETIEHLALTRDLSLGEATRMLLDKGMETMGLQSKEMMSTTIT